MKQILNTFIVILLTINVLHSQENPWNGPSADFSHGRLIISGNKRFLVYEDGTPFYYLGDTGWELFHFKMPGL